MPKKKSKKFVVDKKFMINLANTIYNTKTRKFLCLCDGTLQNGPDPTTNEKRTMHCGLGELYFKMTGNQPEEDNVNEEDVVDKAVELSAFADAAEQARDRAKKAIRALDLSEDAKWAMIDALNEVDDDDMRLEAEQEFRDTLDEIPSSNDDRCGDSCTTDSFRKRSQRVAAQLREAAKFLPK